MVNTRRQETEGKWVKSQILDFFKSKTSLQYTVQGGF